MKHSQSATAINTDTSYMSITYYPHVSIYSRTGEFWLCGASLSAHSDDSSVHGNSGYKRVLFCVCESFWVPR